LQALDQQINGNEGSTTLGFMVGVDSGGVVAFEATYDANGITTTVSSPSGSNASQTSGSKRTPVEEADLWAGRLVEQFEVRNGSLPAGQRAELFDAYRDHQLEMYLKGPHANDFVLPQFAQFVQETNDAIRYPGPQWGTISKEQIEFSNAAMEERRYQELASKVDPTIKELAILEERYNTEHPGEALRGAAWNALLALGGFYAGARNSNNLAGLPGTTGSPTKVQTVDPKVQTTELVQPGGMPSSQRPAIKLGPGPYGDYYEGKANSSKATAAPNQGSWQPGNNINAPTSKGTPPSDRTVGRRFWKNEALSPSRADYMPADFVRMRKGLPPQRYNPDKGGVESMERSHEPVPRRDGGKDMVPRWPQEHAEVDPQRRPGY
jgi:filamentous hemagglutinin